MGIDGAMTSPDTLSFCGDAVRRHDNDRYLTALFAPPGQREALFALYAFNHEIAKTREVVSEPLLGQIRLQWWRDAVGELYEGNPRRHEVIQPLDRAIGEYRLERAYFDRLIDARERDLDDDPPASLADLMDYAEATGAPLIRLALQVLGAEGADEAGRHVGIAWALVGTLRAVPFQASRQRLRLPADLLEKAGVRPGRLFDGKPEPGLARVAAAVADAARTHLRAARAARPRRQAAARAALPALLPGALASLHLRVLARAGYDPFAARVQMPHPLRQLRLAWSALLGRW